MSAGYRDGFYGHKRNLCLFPRWWQLPYYWAGIKMYDVVAGIHCLKSSYVLTKSKALELFPMLNKDKLVGAIVYYDGGSKHLLLQSSSVQSAERLLDS